VDWRRCEPAGQRPNYALNTVESDADFTCNTRNFARAVSGAQRPSVWRYLFTHTYENDASLREERAFHTAELPFVSGNLETRVLVNPYSPSSAEIALSNAIMDYWARFAATSDPNGSGAVAQWLPYDAGENLLQGESGRRLPKRAVRFSVNPAYQVLVTAAVLRICGSLYAETNQPP
jgi:carboxylesterase type B